VILVAVIEAVATLFEGSLVDAAHVARNFTVSADCEQSSYIKTPETRKEETEIC
jgi:hypothetical protein